MADQSSALATHVDKWHQRQPEMAVAEVFVPAAQRPLFRAWGALGNELLEACFEVADAGVARTKLAWWVQDLSAGEGARHPLARALRAAGAGEVPATLWRDFLLHATPLCAVAPESDDSDVDADLERLRPLAQALAVIEASVLGVAVDASADALAVHLYARRHLWRQSTADAALRPRAQRLLERFTVGGSSVLAACRARADRRRLRRLARHGDPQRARERSHWQTLWDSWRAAGAVARARGRA